MKLARCLALGPLATAALVLCAVPLAAGADLPELRVGMETRLPPWSFVPDIPRRPTPAMSAAELQKLTGLDVEVMKAVADLGQQKLRVGHIDDPAVKRSLYALGGGRFEVRTTVPQLFSDLIDSKLDAVVYDSLYVRWRASRQHDVRVVGEPLNRLGYHLGLRKADAALLREVEAAVRTLRDSGELSRIQARWEGR